MSDAKSRHPSNNQQLNDTTETIDQKQEHVKNSRIATIGNESSNKVMILTKS